MRYLISSMMSLLAFLVVNATVWADPSVPGFTVTPHASVSTPLRLSFDPSGVLYAGNQNVSASSIHRIGVGGSPVTTHGGALYDPDAVLFDGAGHIGPPGSVLVGRQHVDGVAQGSITVIRPDQTMYTFDGPTSEYRNPADMEFDSSGRLIFTDVEPSVRSIFVSTGGAPSLLFTLPSGARPDGIAIDAADRIFTSSTDGVIRIHNSVGGVVNGAFATGLGANVSLAVGPGGAFGSDLYVMDSNGNLLRFDSLGNSTTLGTGFVSVGDMAFGPDGALYVSESVNNRVLRVAPPDVPALSHAGATVLLVLLAGAGAASVRVLSPAACPRA